MSRPSTPVAGVTRPCIIAASIGVVVIPVVAVVVVVVLVVPLTLVPRRVRSAEPCSVSPSVATGAMEFPAFAVMVEAALIATGKITGVGS